MCNFVLSDETETFQLHSIRNYWIISPIYLEIVIFMTADSVGGRNRSFYTNRKMSMCLQIHYYDVKFNYFLIFALFLAHFFIFYFLGTKLQSFVKTQQKWISLQYNFLKKIFLWLNLKHGTEKIDKINSL